jgi:hypothetical protein
MHQSTCQIRIVISQIIVDWSIDGKKNYPIDFYTKKFGHSDNL